MIGRKSDHHRFRIAGRKNEAGKAQGWRGIATFWLHNDLLPRKGQLFSYELVIFSRNYHEKAFFSHEGYYALRCGLKETFPRKKGKKLFGPYWRAQRPKPLASATCHNHRKNFGHFNPLHSSLKKPLAT
jgi:hypothetical protein